MRTCPKCKMVAVEWIEDSTDPADGYYDCQNCGFCFDINGNQV